ncbi:mycofactocin-coupled SDR family oxidoreductase [Mycolicibacterium goodii]|uniref:mycofactocin-coupled SDR family oxidoreductase n=1 Tax=Mycolicibacterium goodii TaxID=134601 RepID=UPI001F0443D7|nr:mycofactocin-coupled SDR family oxidoreductase [Mycolicibacterium goodii]ULN49576.1 mycofactocin-coupled SDR family oxidoreductase [Mycolicibacterium goodii]
MSQKLAGKVALVTGAARGQGRSHAIRLAEEGADIIALDLCEQIDTVHHPLATPEDLRETVAAVEATGRRIVSCQTDVRDADGVNRAVAEGISRLGRLDIIVANAGIAPQSVRESDQYQTFLDTIAVNLTGVYNTVHAGVDQIIEQGEGGSIILISSTQGLTGRGGNGSGAQDGYTASKHGVIGLMKTWSFWLAPKNIRVNAVAPTGVNTPMVDNDVVREWLEKDPDAAGVLANQMPIPVIEASDVSSAVAWLATDEARYVTGVALPVDAGFLIK